jgi:hypothetical protein
MTGAAFAQDRYYSPAPAEHCPYYSDDRPYYGHAAYDRDDEPYYREDSRTVVHDNPDPGAHAVRGGAFGAGLGAAIGCIVTIPVGCASGAKAAVA